MSVGTHIHIQDKQDRYFLFLLYVETVWKLVEMQCCCAIFLTRNFILGDMTFLSSLEAFFFLFQTWNESCHVTVIAVVWENFKMLVICKNKTDSVELIHDCKERPLFLFPSVYEIHKDILEVTNDVCIISIYFLQKQPFKNASNTSDSLLFHEKQRF